jgi:hypothetical protein
MTKTSPTFSVKNIALLIFLGLSIVLPAGLYMLTVGPSRMIADKARIENWSENQENLIQKITIFIFCILILIITLLLIKKFNKSTPFIQKLILILSSVSLFGTLYIFTFKPELLISNSETNDSFEKNEGIEFYFGSYPDADKMEELKSENYTAIISLLHNMVIPAEPILMKKEADNATKTGIKLISIPMLPWIIENDSALIKIKQLAKNAKGKYYVHCYLGKDRVNVFKSIIEKENNAIKIKNNFAGRNIDTISKFERGKIYKLNSDIYLTPYPTDEEFFSFIFNGKIKSVVSLMDTKISGEKPFIIREGNIMKQYNMNFKNFPVKYSETNKIKVLLDSINKLPKPLIIHNFSTQSSETEKFVSAIKSKIKNN